MIEIKTHSQPTQNNICYPVVYEEGGMRKLKTADGEVYFLIKEEQIQSDITKVTEKMVEKGEQSSYDKLLWSKQMNNVILVINTYLNDYMKTYNPGEKESINKFADSLFKSRGKIRGLVDSHIYSLNGEELEEFSKEDNLKKFIEEQEKTAILAALKETGTYIKTFGGIK